MTTVSLFPDKIKTGITTFQALVNVDGDESRMSESKSISSLRRKRNIHYFLLALLPISLFWTNWAYGGESKGQPWSVRMAESIMTRHPQGYGQWDYVTGTVLKGFEELWRKTGEDRYFQYIQKTVDAAVDSNGTIRGYKLSDYNLDEINEGRMLLFLYKETGQEKYKKAADLLKSQLDGQPRNSLGGFWHKKRYPYQMWLDGLYMGSPFYAEYGMLFDQPEIFDDVVK
jgi:hypothetical protein